MAKNINNKAYDAATLLKLDIFRECFKQWLPVFIHSIYFERVYIYDFFAGSGTDVNGVYGSPLILLDVAKGDNCTFCNSVKKNNKKVAFVFNEKEKGKKQAKFDLLSSNISQFIDKCKQENSCSSKCIYDVHPVNEDFKERFNSNETSLHKILKNPKYAKFILLDQYGFSQVDEDVFLTLVKSPATDFIFFISSSYIKRFREHENTKKYIDTNQIQFDENKTNECHITIAKYFEHLTPKNVEYYMSHYTIKKGSNYYGLIFGTNHTLGMEKFQKACWANDVKAGESNCNTQSDFGADTLFGSLEPNKIVAVKQKIIDAIKNGEITNNIAGLKYTLKQKCLPKLFSEVVKELETNNIIKRNGSTSYTSTNIHKIKVDSKDYYSIELL